MSNERDDYFKRQDEYKKAKEQYDARFQVKEKIDDSILIAFEKISDIRKFEIELYWKRTAYFWALIAMVFVAYFSFISIGNTIENRQIYLMLISSMGMVLTFAWLLANKGSKYWQENWENHLDLIEDKVTGALYKTILQRPSAKDEEMIKRDRYEEAKIEKENNPIQKEKSKSCIAKRLYTKIISTTDISLLWMSELVTKPSPYSVSKINQLVGVFVFLIWFCQSIYVLCEVSIWAAQGLGCMRLIVCSGIFIIAFLFVRLLIVGSKTHMESTNPVMRLRTVKIFKEYNSDED
ncbi:hypothetical protein ACAX46_003722 [Providencia rettgeri]